MPAQAKPVTQRPVALLDVDHTLLFHDKDNNDLMDSLLEAGITDVYLLTDMVFKAVDIADREKLIGKLRERGFTVHGCITPSDLAWGISAQGAEAAWAALSTTESNSEAFDSVPEVQALVANGYSPGTMRAGAAYKEAREGYPGNIGELDPLADIEQLVQLDTQQTPKDNISKSRTAKLIADDQSQALGYPHTKGLLLDLFLQHKPEWVGPIVVADDNDDVCNAIRDFRPVNKGTPLPPITMIKVGQVAHGKEYYARHLQPRRFDAFLRFFSKAAAYRHALVKLRSKPENTPRPVEPSAPAPTQSGDHGPLTGDPRPYLSRFISPATGSTSETTPTAPPPTPSGDYYGSVADVRAAAAAELANDIRKLTNYFKAYKISSEKGANIIYQTAPEHRKIFINNYLAAQELMRTHQHELLTSSDVGKSLQKLARGYTKREAHFNIYREITDGTSTTPIPLGYTDQDTLNTEIAQLPKDAKRENIDNKEKLEAVRERVSRLVTYLRYTPQEQQATGAKEALQDCLTALKASSSPGAAP